MTHLTAITKEREAFLDAQNLGRGWAIRPWYITLRQNGVLRVYTRHETEQEALDCMEQWGMQMTHEEVSVQHRDNIKEPYTD